MNGTFCSNSQFKTGVGVKRDCLGSKTRATEHARLFNNSFTRARICCRGIVSIICHNSITFRAHTFCSGTWTISRGGISKNCRYKSQVVCLYLVSRIARDPLLITSPELPQRGRQEELAVRHRSSLLQQMPEATRDFLCSDAIDVFS